MDHGTAVRTIKTLAEGVPAFAAALERVSPSEVPALVEFVSKHRLGAWLAPALADERVRSRLPVAFLRAAAEEDVARRARTDRMVEETLEIDGALSRAGVEALYVKGLGFGVRFYGDVHRRWQRDVDVLVRGRDVAAAIAAIESVGYVKEEGRIGEGAVRRGLRRGDATVDLHWNLRRRARRRLPEDDLWRDRVRFSLAGRPLETLSDENTLLFLLLSICGDLRRGACSARHFLDLHLLLRAFGPTTSWPEYLGRRREQALVMPCVNVLAVFLSLWHATGDHPGVARAVEDLRSLVVIRDEAEACALLERPRGAPENETWFRRAYPYDRAGAWARRLTLDLPRTLGRLFTVRSFALPSDG